MPYDRVEVGEIILVPFPFTDLSSQKTRPAVVLSTKTLHSEDIIVGAISSKMNPVDIVITNADIEKGALPVVSYCKLGKITTLSIRIVKSIIGKLLPGKTNEILEKTKDLF